MAGQRVGENNQDLLICWVQRNIRILIIFATGLVAMYVFNFWMGQPSWNLTRLIDLDGEGNLPTWFSNFLWICVAGATLHLAVALERQGRIQSQFWKFAGVVFLCLSMDEIAQLHEKLGQAINNKLVPVHFHWSPWVVLLGPFLLLAAAVFLNMIYRQLRNDSKVCKKVFGGLILFIFAAYFLDLSVFFFNRNLHPNLYFGEVALEEYLEMLGAILVLSGILDFSQKIVGHSHLIPEAGVSRK